MKQLKKLLAVLTMATVAASTPVMTCASTIKTASSSQVENLTAKIDKVFDEIKADLSTAGSMKNSKFVHTIYDSLVNSGLLEADNKIIGYSAKLQKLVDEKIMVLSEGVTDPTKEFDVDKQVSVDTLVVTLANTYKAIGVQEGKDVPTDKQLEKIEKATTKDAYKFLCSIGAMEYDEKFHEATAASVLNDLTKLNNRSEKIVTNLTAEASTQEDKETSSESSSDEKTSDKEVAVEIDEKVASDSVDKIVEDVTEKLNEEEDKQDTSSEEEDKQDTSSEEEDKQDASSEEEDKQDTSSEEEDKQDTSNEDEVK